MNVKDYAHKCPFVVDAAISMESVFRYLETRGIQRQHGYEKGRHEKAIKHDAFSPHAAVCRPATAHEAQEIYSYLVKCGVEFRAGVGEPDSDEPLEVHKDYIAVILRRR